MTYENLWDIPSVNEVLNSTDNIFDIMKAQGQYLKENTNGRIFGKFSKIKTINPLSTMGAALTAFAPREVLQNNDSSALADANELYRDQKYGFEIYNSAYKFRVFEMIILPVYPAQIIIDEGVVILPTAIKIPHDDKNFYHSYKTAWGIHHKQVICFSWQLS